ncbi:MAG: hypothetical protein A2751_05430 [Candidatus Doudnabacteria bacterium RIFCSPHIGHO2_01_FULL_46_14]|uniref:Uncharacterized protein n=1 Tax=Candidatus Doudnabacteria bacterium RIFCSPHIGHO2_01_FULL_46_14 TaxID=1817824 RepID=A0A1F5NPJ2_9BACT|nr:MAG: hypothetical protein A2751_05430 [Candidatus Doudnabacteria bacterium RIFCSPHIGHO2_01_FULL_46_14]
MNRRRGEGAPELHEQEKRISKVHFLVHPGWMMKDNAFAAMHKGVNRLMNRYVEQAEAVKLNSNELMVAFAPAIDAEFVHDFREKEKPYTQTITKLKDILGDRLIVLADSDEEEDRYRGATFKENKEKVWAKIKTIAENRGFHFDEQLTAEAYGELIKACVRLIADNMHEASGMSEPVKLKANLTDYPLFLDDASRRIAEARKEYGDNIYLSERTKIDFSDNKKPKKK